MADMGADSELGSGAGGCPRLSRRLLEDTRLLPVLLPLTLMGGRLLLTGVEGGSRKS